jgi:hypothetical protein
MPRIHLVVMAAAGESLRLGHSLTRHLGEFGGIHDEHFYSQLSCPQPSGRVLREYGLQQCELRAKPDRLRVNPRAKLDRPLPWRAGHDPSNGKCQG